MALVTAGILTSPWWLAPAVNTLGIGSLMLHDYIRNRGLSAPQMKTSSDEENWLTTGEFESPKVKPNVVDNSISRFVPTAKEEVEIKVVPEVKTDTTFKASPPNNNNNGKKKKSDDDKYWKAARAAALWELVGKGVETVTKGSKNEVQTPDTVVEDQSETGKDGYTLGQKVTAFLNNQSPETRYGVNNYGGDRIPLSEIIRAQDYDRRRNRFELTPQEQKTTIMSPLEQEMYW